MNNGLSRKPAWYVFLFIPFVLGFAGFMAMPGYDAGHAVYSTLQLYKLTLDVPWRDMNTTLQIALWLAAAASLSVIYVLLFTLLSTASTWMKLLRRDIIVLHGAEEYIKLLEDALHTKTIRCTSPLCYKAKRHILAFESDAALTAYMARHMDAWTQDGKEIYACTQDVETLGAPLGGVTLCDMGENCARLYWQEHYLTEQEQSIAFIGDDLTCAKLLRQALLVNVLPFGKRLRYYAMGDFSAFKARHMFLDRCVSVGSEDETRDSLSFLPDYHAALPILRTCDRVILSFKDAADAVNCVGWLLSQDVCSVLHVRLPESVLADTLIRTLQQDARNNPRKPVVTCFGADEKLYSQSVIMRRGMLRLAMSMADDYYQRHGGTQWDDFPAFTKGSNIAAADHLPVKVRAVLRRDIADPINEETAAQYERALEKAKQDEDNCRRLCEAEHIRWMRYHYLNNWDYKEGLQRKDMINRLHPDLIPYDALDAAEQYKDFEQYEAVAGAIRNALANAD